MSDVRPVIAVDAMGGDHGPAVIVPGALAALTPDSPFELALYGDEVAIKAAMEQAGCENLPDLTTRCHRYLWELLGVYWVVIGRQVRLV